MVLSQGYYVIYESPTWSFSCQSIYVSKAMSQIELCAWLLPSGKPKVASVNTSELKSFVFATLLLHNQMFGPLQYQCSIYLETWDYVKHGYNMEILEANFNARCLKKMLRFARIFSLSTWSIGCSRNLLYFTVGMYRTHSWISRRKAAPNLSETSITNDNATFNETIDT